MGNDTQTPSSASQMLRQVLSQPNACIGFLIGAGCPASIKTGAGADEAPLIPAVDALTSDVRSSMSAELGPHLETICEWLETKQGGTPNIEDILSRIRLEREVVREGSPIPENTLTDLEEAVCSKVRDAVKCELPGDNSPFHSLAHWVKHFRSASPVEIFTTNYDLLLEQAFEDTATPYFDGFIGGRKAFFDVDSFEATDLPASWSKLWKLHGSINWRQCDRNQIVRTSADDSNSNLIIYPSYLKYSETQKLPFTAMFDKFREFLKKKSCFLIILGYSFRDAHINAIIDTSLARNPGLKILALQYSTLDKYANATELASNHGNLLLMAQDAFMSGRRRSSWQPDEGTAGDPATATAPAKFELGNFVNLGLFIDEFVGEAHLHAVSDTKESEDEDQA